MNRKDKKRQSDIRDSKSTIWGGRFTSGPAEIMERININMITVNLLAVIQIHTHIIHH